MIKLIFAGLFCLPSILWAGEWVGVQGDIVPVHIHSDVEIAGLSCFGKHWPVKQLAKGEWQGWIGIDLKKRANVYPITWQAKATQFHDTLQVKAGHFRVSRIQVAKKMASFDAAAIKRIRSDQAAIKATYAMPVSMDTDFTAAVAPVHGVESTPFGAQRYVNGEARSPHAGVDIATPQGTPVLAPLAGEVLLVESMFLNGNLMVLGHGHGLVTVYAHLSHFDVKQGEKVGAGQKIGEVGSTGRSTGAHLHWGMRFYNARVDPKSLLKLANTPLNLAE